MFKIIFQEGEFISEASGSDWPKLFIPLLGGFLSAYFIFLLQEKYKKYKDNLDKIIFLKLLIKNIISKTNEINKLKAGYIAEIERLLVVRPYPISNIIEFLNRFSIRIDQEKYLEAYKRARHSFWEFYYIKPNQLVVRTSHYNIITKQIDYLHFSINNLIKTIENYQKFNYEFQLKYTEIEKRVRKKLHLNTNPAAPFIIQTDSIRRETVVSINDTARVTFLNFNRNNPGLTTIKKAHEELYGFLLNWINENHRERGIITSDVYIDLEEMNNLYTRNLNSINSLINDVNNIKFSDCRDKLQLIYSKRLKDF